MFGCSLLLLSPSFFILLHSIKNIGWWWCSRSNTLTSLAIVLIDYEYTIVYEYFTPGVSCRPPCWWRFGRSGAPVYGCNNVIVYFGRSIPY